MNFKLGGSVTKCCKKLGQQKMFYVNGHPGGVVQRSASPPLELKIVGLNPRLGVNFKAFLI
jgi:hypothetical protein